MDSDFKFIGILTVIVLILGIIFTLKITIFKSDGLSSLDANLAITNTEVTENEIDSVATINTNTTTNNNINNTKEEIERENANKRLNEINEQYRKDKLEMEENTKKANEANEKIKKYENKQQTKNGVLYILSSLIIPVIILLALYYIFKNYNFKTGLLVYSTYTIIASCIQNGFHFLTIFLALIVAIIETSISYVVYTKSKSFLNFLLKLFLVATIIIVIIVIIGTVIAMNNGNNGILSRAQ